MNYTEKMLEAAEEKETMIRRKRLRATLTEEEWEEQSRRWNMALIFGLPPEGESHTEYWKRKEADLKN